MALDPKLRDAYTQARQAVLVAKLGDPPDLAAVEAARERFEAATAAVADLVEAAWDRNVQAIQDAKTAFVEARREQTRVEVEAGNAARARNPSAPVLTVDELDRCRAAAAATETARETVTAAELTFKAGVTGDQLDEVA